MSQFQILTQEQIQDARKCGMILRTCLEHLASSVREGMETAELNRIADEFIRSHDGAEPAFFGYSGYPASLCVSVNDQCVHGIPGTRVLAGGDVVGLDCGVRLANLCTDACVSVMVGEGTPQARQLLQATERALGEACKVVRSGARVGDISSTVQRTVEGAGFQCVRGLTGHGIGTNLHQFPDIPNTGKAGTGPMIPAHTLLAIEPITSMGTSDIRDTGDGWTICTADGSLSAHFEHTVLVLPEGCEIIA